MIKSFFFSVFFLSMILLGFQTEPKCITSHIYVQCNNVYMQAGLDIHSFFFFFFCYEKHRDNGKIYFLCCKNFFY